MTNAGPVPSVYFDKASGKWHARVYQNRRYIHAGRVDSKSAAFKKAEEKIRELLHPVEQDEPTWEERAAEARHRIVGAGV